MDIQCRFCGRAIRYTDAYYIGGETYCSDVCSNIGGWMGYCTHCGCGIRGEEPHYFGTKVFEQFCSRECQFAAGYAPCTDCGDVHPIRQLDLDGYCATCVFWLEELG